MRNRSLAYGLALLVLVTAAGESRCQDTCGSAGRSETLIDLFQHRIFGSSCDCGCDAKAIHETCYQKAAPLQKAAPVQKVAPVQKAVPVQKPAPVQKLAPVQKPVPVQKPTVVQKSIPSQKVPCVIDTPSVKMAPSVQRPVCEPIFRSVQKETCVPRPACVQRPTCEQKSSTCQKGDFMAKGAVASCGCEPCGYCHSNPITDMVQRLDGALLRIFPTPVCSKSKDDGKGDGKADGFVHHDKGCGCDGSIIEDDLPVTIPDVPKPQFDNNPFQDDTLQPAPLPSAPSREARLLRQESTNRTADAREPLQPVRAASHYFEPIRVE